MSSSARTIGAGILLALLVLSGPAAAGDDPGPGPSSLAPARTSGSQGAGAEETPGAPSLALDPSLVLDAALDPSEAQGPASAQEPSWRGRAISAASIGALYTGLTVWAYFAWYHGVSQGDFAVGGDGWFGANTYAGGSDKLGHVWANNAFARISSEILIAGGWQRLPASLLASTATLSFFTFVEVKDGYYYSFSIGDMVGNAAGAALSALLINLPALDELVDFRVEYRPSTEFLASPSVNLAEDYSGQTYLLAFHLAGVPGLGEQAWMRWGRYLDLVVGYQSLNYKPTPRDRDIPRSQELFVGVALNMQQVLDRLVGSPRGSRRGLHKAGHTALGLFGLPYTSMRLAEARRSPDAR